MSNPQNPTTMKLQFGELNITSKVEERLSELGYTVAELQNAVARHKSCYDGEPSVYVGTYGKYNDGSLSGLWVDISSFRRYDEFIAFCKAIHADEADPELMAQDYENFPRQWYNEGFITEDDFDNILEYTDMCKMHGQEAVNDYLEFYDGLDNFDDAYYGEWDSEEDFARHIVEECYDIEKAMGNLAVYFDYEAFARDLFMCDYSMGSNNHVFRRF